MKTFLIVLIALASLLSLNYYFQRQRPAFPGGKIIDLTYAFDEETIFWPTAEGFRLTKDAEGMTEKRYYYAANSFCTAEHGGTHIDSPIHFAKDRNTVDQIPLEQLVGHAILIDVSKKALANRDYKVTAADIQEWERANQRIPRDVILLLRTGYGRFWPDRKKYMGTDERGPDAVPKLHFPGLHPEAAKWLVENRSIKAIGLDTPSIDFGQSTLFESHRILFEKNIPAFENVANLDKLQLKNFDVVALPMKIKGGTGGPLRIVAIVP